ncbi:MAG: marine proteobacterial sortase target protein [Proteobacteria bacterium]|nr:marine proteobacterial sortase target protein [Pseudomonadota bacterium]
MQRTGTGRSWVVGMRGSALFVLALGLLCAWLDAAAAPLEEVAGGSLLFRDETGSPSVVAPQLETDVEIRVTGVVSRVRVRQRFENPSDRWVEGIYVFPLPPDAAVDTLHMEIGERRIEGQIQERAAAVARYTAAKREGRQASLVEQERPNLFTTSVANVAPLESIVVEIAYQETLRLQDEVFELRLPLVVGTRYIPGQPAVEAGGQDVTFVGFEGDGWARRTRLVPDAHRITPFHVHPADGPVNPVRVAVALDLGFPVAEIESPSHRVAVERGGEGGARVLLSQAFSDRDFVLRFAPDPAVAPRAALFTQPHADEHYALLMLMPPADGAARARRLQRETIFVIDTSGSMGGASIRQARDALRMALGRLTPLDRFNVIAFADRPLALFDTPVAANAQALERARGFVSRLEANGGTEMQAALERALDSERPEDPSVVRQVLFITDGSVGNEAQLFGTIRQRLGDRRLFTVGIGSAPNAHFMQRAAQFGRGTYTFIGSAAEVAEHMGGLFAKLESPVLSQIEVHWPDPVEQWPTRIPDLYAGEPIVLTARVPRLQGEVRVTGVRGERPFSVRLPLEPGSARSGIDKLFARRQIASLMDGLVEGVDPARVKQDVLALALKHHLVSKYTSLVAVDVTPVRPASEGLARRAVPHNVPAGWDPSKLPGVLPRGATPAALWFWSGVGSLVLGALVWRRSRSAC